MLPIGVRRRQLRVRTLLAGMLLSQADHRPAHLTRVHEALIALPDDDQAPARRDRGLEDTARTSSPTGRPSAPSAWSPAPWPRTSPTGRPRRSCARICDDLLEASIPEPVQAGQQGAGGGLDATWRPSPARRRTGPATAPTPRPPGDTARATCCAARTGAVLRLLPVGRDHDARGARPGRPRADPADDRVAPARPTQPAPWSRC